MDKVKLYHMALAKCLAKGISTEDEKLRAFYYLSKYIVCKGNKCDSKSDFNLTLLDESFLKGVSTKRFIQFFPIRKRYDGAKYEVKDYYSTIEAVKRHGDTIQDVYEFLWDYFNTHISFYVVRKTCLMSSIREVETGQSLFEDLGMKPMYLREFEGKKVMYNPETQKTLPVKENRKRPKWIKLIK